MCRNDDLAIGAYRGMCDLGISVGKDVLLVGCDGVEETRFMPCPVSTIVLPVRQMCQLAWQFMERRLAHPAAELQSKLWPRSWKCGSRRGGRVATIEGSRGFQPTVGDSAKVRASRSDARDLGLSSAILPNFGNAITAAFNRRYATKRFLAISGPWVETHGYIATSLRDADRWRAGGNRGSRLPSVPGRMEGNH